MKTTKRVATVAVLLLAVSLFLWNQSADAKSTTLDKINEAEREQDQTEQEKNEAEDRKENAENLSDSLEAKQNYLKSELDGLNQSLTEIGANIATLEGQITDKEQEITDKTAEVQCAEQETLSQYEAMKKRIQFMYEKSESIYLAVLFSSSSISDFLTVNEYMEKITEYDREMLTEYQENLRNLQLAKEELEQQKTDLNTMKQTMSDEQNRVSDVMATVANHVADYGNQIADMQDVIHAYENEIAAHEAEIATRADYIEALKKQYQDELAMSLLAHQSSWRDISEITFAEGDRYLLANLIYCEAGGEPYEGQVAVGSVVMNRVLSSVYPDTVVGVIYQNRQFAPVADGHLALALAQNKATDACYRAADEAMSGMTNVGDRVYFRTPIEGLTGLSIGGHIFY